MTPYRASRHAAPRTTLRLRWVGMPVPSELRWLVCIGCTTFVVGATALPVHRVLGGALGLLVSVVGGLVLQLVLCAVTGFRLRRELATVPADESFEAWRDACDAHEHPEVTCDDSCEVCNARGPWWRGGAR